MFDFEDDGVWFFDDHAVPDTGFEVYERGAWGEVVARYDRAVGIEDEDFEGAGDEVD